jgi:hypothetical protein
MSKNDRAPRRSREEWRALVGEWKTAGGSARGFADPRGLSSKSLLNWSSVFEREPVARTGPKLLPVRVSAGVSAPERALELIVGPLRVRFDAGTPPGYVADLARAMLDAASS